MVGQKIRREKSLQINFTVTKTVVQKFDGKKRLQGQVVVLSRGKEVERLNGRCSVW